MYMIKGCIVDFPMDTYVQADIIECFKNDDSNIIFIWVEPNEEEKNMSVNWESNPWADIKKTVAIINKKLDDMEEIYNNVYYYVVDSHEELVDIIIYYGLILDFYIVNKKNNIKDYEYKIDTDENHIVEEEGNEHRSLFYEGKSIKSFNENILSNLRNKIAEYNSL